MQEIYNGDLCYLQFDHYRQFPELIHGVFTRQGGYSDAPYSSLNMSSPQKGNGDNHETVIRNRQAVLDTLQISNAPCAAIWQIHGADVHIVERGSTWRTDWSDMSHFHIPWTKETIRMGDGLISQETGMALSMSFADCVPLLFYDPETQAFGIAHGGWKGTARGIALATIEKMHEQFGSQPEHIYAGIGPAIGTCCYEVSKQVQDLFMGLEEFETMPTHPDYRATVRESATFSIMSLPDKESLRIDLQETNRKQLLMAGLPADHIEIMDVCTSCNNDRFFSHRKEQGKTGRFGVVIALQPFTNQANEPMDTH